MLLPIIIIIIILLLSFHYVLFCFTNVSNIQYCIGDQFTEQFGYSNSLPLLLLLLCVIHFYSLRENILMMMMTMMILVHFPASNAQ